MKKTGIQMRAIRALLGLVALSLVTCTSVGPKSLPRDNFAYNDALGMAWKREMLLNMVKLRYGDAPVFLKVASLINQYSVEGQLSLSTPGWDRPNQVGPPIGGVAGRWADRPTVTYLPMSGEQFTRNLLTPMRPVTLLTLVQSGWPVEFVFGVAVRSINGVANGTRAHLLQQRPDPRFGELLEAMTEIQRSSAIDLRIERRPDSEVAIIVLQRGRETDLTEARTKVRDILDLQEGSSEFRLAYGSLASQPNEIAILTRSMLEILGEFSFGIEVDPVHVSEGRVRPAPQFDGPWQPPTIRVRSGTERPDNAFVAIPYRDSWFWIDDRDFATKRRFSFLMIMLSLTETGSSPGAPLLTVTTGG